MKVLAFDIDGVLNCHQQHAGSPYNGIDRKCMGYFNQIIEETGCVLLLSSAWRYQILCGATTVRGFEFLLFSHGLKPRSDGAPLLLGHTPSDEAILGRGAQIQAALYSLLPRKVEAWAALDDCPGTMRQEFAGIADRLVQTDGEIGLTSQDARRVIEMLRG